MGFPISSATSFRPQSPPSTPASGGIDQMLSDASSQLTQAGQSDSPLGKLVDGLKKALESGQISPQQAAQALQQGLQQAQQGQQPQSPSSVSPTSNPTAQQPQAPAAPQQTPDQFQQAQQQAQKPELTGRGHHGGHHKAHKAAMKSAADALGMSPQDLQSELKSGKSMSDIAQERGVDPQKVSSAIQSSLQQALPNASADEIQRIANRISGAPTASA